MRLLSSSSVNRYGSAKMDEGWAALAEQVLFPERSLRNDDFVFPHNPDMSTECTSWNGTPHRIGVSIAAAVSLACYAYLFWMYFVVNSPIFKRHPTTLAIYKCFFEVFYVLQYLWLPFLSTGKLYLNGYQEYPYVCRASSIAAGLAFVTQFTLVGSELCFLVISIDLRLAYTNPFSSFKQNIVYFASIILGVSLGTASIVLLFGPEVYGLSDIGLAWIQSRRKHLSINYPKALFYYLIVLSIYSYCTWANFQFYKGSERGFSKTVSNRLSIMQRSKKFTAAYVVYGFATFGVEFLSFLMSSDSSHVLPAPAYLYALRGVFGVIVIFFSNYADLSWEALSPWRCAASKSTGLLADVAQERLLLQPHLNTALRAEILHFTTQGIMFAAKTHEHRLNNEETSADHEHLDHMGDGRLFSFADDGRPSLFHFNNKPDDTENALDEEALTARDTFSHLRRLEIAQTAAITNELGFALEDEVEQLGANPAMVLPKSRVSQSVMRSKQSATVVNPLSATTLSQRETVAGIELAERETNESATSAASNSTVKWRDTMDVEFLIGSSARDSDMPSWKRVSTEPAGNHTLPERNISSNSTTSSLKQALSNAIENASAVFSPAYKEFRFKDYCPKLFAKIRQMHNISAASYASSFETTCKEKFSEGRSGAFMFFSSDQKHIVKTTNKEESMSLHRIMPRYVKFLEENPNSLIVRFLGSHCITMYGVEVYFVVMLNVFPLSPLSERYDLKGSWVNRHGFNGSRRTRKELSRNAQSDSAPLFQDNDLQNTICLEPQVACSLALQIRKDIQFLHGMHFMDYSILIGVRRERFRVMSKTDIHRTGNASEDIVIRATELDDELRSSSIAYRPVDVQQNEDAFKRESDGAMRALLVDGPGYYYVGIIDILQEWNWKKRVERFFKIYIKRLDGDGLSAIQPTVYADRFWKRCILDTFEGLDDSIPLNALE